ncbi:hypothetical protein KTR66_17005 [Roseococcus sp. SDR]|uniref:hypothetical protein n=1 Tax=Roseococcus sp. SDR TaxID=2835532 RepID=UPI001BCEAD42|nr:hypothetical protein [Roseococcus sp. SDR]MBS7791706.1 hypothetical protein [Roseococcus sp. SDR]MBV1847020.1 hypothetical protein [Roseococcus sp. SDR]
MPPILPHCLGVTVNSQVALPRFAANVAQACPSLIFCDQAEAICAGRTLELAMELPDQVTALPAGLSCRSRTSLGALATTLTRRSRMLAGTIPDTDLHGLKIVQGFNEPGLTLGLLACTSASGPRASANRTRVALAAMDLGAFASGQFAMLAEAKAALAPRQ